MPKLNDIKVRCLQKAIKVRCLQQKVMLFIKKEPSPHTIKKPSPHIKKPSPQPKQDQKEFILTTDKGAGLFSSFLRVIGALNQNHRISVIFGDQCLYYDKLYGHNVWEYYFEKINNSKNGKHTTGREFIGHAVGKCGLINQQQRNQNYLTINKFIKLKSPIISHLNIYDYGIHFRSTDKHKEATNIDVNSFIQLLKQIELNGNVFLATDSQFAFNTILKYLKSKSNINVFFQNIERSEKPIHFTRGSYKAGQEALFDMISISKSNKIIHNKSNMSAAALSFNPNAVAIYFN